ncbi:MAG TPA: CpsB/CapC family capsule biosynthesis tyrosine phosphatase [Kaistia sp.]|nr:CpsB/CapC family capsule biosynthesis tyrosine phosphatase [Kaistia sp.]
MIDLHCHILPGIDDGAPDIDVSIAMARAAVADGITVTACTPHIMPGVYNNSRTIIEERMAVLSARFAEEGIDLKLVVGADVHMDVELASGLKSGRIPSLNNSRYFLFEPPHHVPPPRIEDNVFSIMSAGYVPILTHPERLSWIESHYAVMERLVKMGVLMQITAGSVTGKFGRRVRHFADKMIDEGLVHILATDAHNLTGRPPNLSHARDLIAERLGEAESIHMTATRPQAIIDNLSPDLMPSRPVAGLSTRSETQKGLLARFGFGRRSRAS